VKELSELDITQGQKRLNKEPNTFEIPDHLWKKPIPTFMLSDIVRIEAIIERESDYIDKIVVICGWVKSARAQKNDSLVFIDLNDGTYNKGIQVVVSNLIPNFSDVLKCATGASLKIKGKIVASPAKGQAVEMLVEDPASSYVNVVGTSEAKGYPLSKKHHTLEHLRENAHLRPRSNVIGAVARIRNNLAYATHIFLQSSGYMYVHTPIITASDCEGAGELFQVTTVLPGERESVEEIPKIANTN
jgi:asparaginyl-tRNA synthetase